MFMCFTAFLKVEMRNNTMFGCNQGKGKGKERKRGMEGKEK